MGALTAKRGISIVRVDSSNVNTDAELSINNESNNVMRNGLFPSSITGKPSSVASLDNSSTRGSLFVGSTNSLLISSKKCYAKTKYIEHN